MKSQRTKILILGAGSLAADIADLIEDTPQYQLMGFVVDQPPYEPGMTLMNKPVFWVDALIEFDTSVKAVCGLTKNQKRNLISKVEAFGIDLIQFIHPSSRISKSSSLGKGVVINSGVQIAAKVQLGDFVYVNRGCLIGHDTSINSYSVLSPGVNIGGNVSVGEGTYIGIGAVILERIRIGDGCFVCAGSVVTRNIGDREKVVGMPAQVVERNIEAY